MWHSGFAPMGLGVNVPADGVADTKALLRSAGRPPAANDQSAILNMQDVAKSKSRILGEFYKVPKRRISIFCDAIKMMLRTLQPRIITHGTTFRFDTFLEPRVHSVFPLFSG